MYKTFITIISNDFDSIEYDQLKNKLSDKGFIIDLEFENIKWQAPHEYESEMGEGLKTKILVLKQRIGKQVIELLKKYSEDLEAESSTSGKRKFNINPGFLSYEGMFLLSHKSNDQRGRTPFGQYFIEKQYDRDSNKFISNQNTFSEYLGERIELFNNLLEREV